MISDSIKRRFESQYMPVTESGCWIWTGSNKNQFGHGAFKIGPRKSRVEYAHRMAWMIYRGEIPSGMHVMHTCDVPSCVNPNHLRLGTRQDNIDDCVNKGRHVFGSKARRSVLNDDLVREIRQRPDERSETLGQMFGVSRQSIADIRANRTWRHVA